MHFWIVYEKFEQIWKAYIKNYLNSEYHGVKGVYIWSFSSPYFSAFGLNTERYSPYSVQMRRNTDQKNSEYGHFSHSVYLNQYEMRANTNSKYYTYFICANTIKYFCPIRLRHINFDNQNPFAIFFFKDLCSNMYCCFVNSLLNYVKTFPSQKAYSTPKHNIPKVIFESLWKRKKF